MKTVKFGGTSLAAAETIRQAAKIVRDDPERCYVVVSAPGKRHDGDEKVTDLLYRLFACRSDKKESSSLLEMIRDRFEEIIRDLDISLSLDEDFEEIKTHLDDDTGEDWFASRGEYLSARVFSAYMGWPMVDPCRLIFFRENHMMDTQLTYSTAGKVLSAYSRAVIPGFYGADADGKVTTFTRGGSDVTGSVIARVTKSSIYENWTDVNGVMSADPRIIDNPRQVRWISYRELRELSYMGASVLHEAAIFPLRATGIPIQIRNTMDPEAEGTMIVSRYPVDLEKHPVTGIAGKKGFSNLQIEMAMMNGMVGFGARVLEIIAQHGISFEHAPTSIDIMSVIAEGHYFDRCRNEILMEIDSEFHPDKLFIEDGLSLVAVVGEGISTNVGVAAKVLLSIAEAGINVRMIDAGCSELNIIIGVDDDDYEKTIRALYDGLYEYL